jgi:hypothetical protein
MRSKPASMIAGATRTPRSTILLVGVLMLSALQLFGQPSETVRFAPAAGTFTGPIQVTLSGAASGQQIRYVAASGVEAASAQVTADSPRYTAPITVSATTVIRAAVFPANGSTPGRTTNALYLRIAPTLATFRSRLPVLVLDDLGAGPLEKDQVDHASWLFGYTPKATATFSGAMDFATPLLTTVRGTSSAEFPKKGYNLKMRTDANRSRAFPIFDLPAFERWALVAPWAFDQNFINNAFVYELSNRVGRWAPRTRLVEVFFNPMGDDLDLTDYAGIYVVTDRIRVEKGRVEIDSLSAGDVAAPAITGGYILKIDVQDPDEIGWTTDHGVPAGGVTSIVLVAPDAGDVTIEQLTYIQSYVQQMENALHSDRATNWSKRTHLDFIDRAAWVDHHILNVLASNPDGLIRSAYFTKPRGGKLQAGPVWDFDRALGAYWDDRTAVVNTWSGVGGSVDVWRSGWWGLLAEDPEFVQEWVDRWQTLRQAQMSTPALTALAQSLATTIGTEAADREAARWPDSASPYGSYAAQIDHLKTWLTERAAWIDSQFAAPPSLSVEAATITVSPPVGAFVAYTLDGSDPRDLGGGIAASAQLASEPITFPADSTVRVRSYDTVLAMSGRFPATPWSVDVTSEAGPGLNTDARIVNLSTRAVISAEQVPLIIGFVVDGAVPKRFLARAIGPGLSAFGESAPAAAPRLSIATSVGLELASNRGWQTSEAAAELPTLASSVGAFALTDSGDSALVIDLSRGMYTMQIANESDQPGAVLAEFYELDQQGRLANVSIRSPVQGDTGVMISGGFVVGGAGSKRLLIRAVGPSLRTLGVVNAVADPLLKIFSNRILVAANDSWSSGGNGPIVEAARNRVGGFALASGSQDAALARSFSPGVYTFEVSSAFGGEGMALVEIYDVR